MINVIITSNFFIKKTPYNLYFVNEERFDVQARCTERVQIVDLILKAQKAKKPIPLHTADTGIILMMKLTNDKAEKALSWRNDPWGLCRGA